MQARDPTVQMSQDKRERGWHTEGSAEWPGSTGLWRDEAAEERRIWITKGLAHNVKDEQDFPHVSSL